MAGPLLLSIAPALRGQRFPDRTEAAAYFCGVALAAHLDETDGSARLELALQDGCLVVRATGGAGGMETGRSAIVDRVEAAGGRVWTGRGPEGRVDLRVDFPLPAGYACTADAQTAASRSVPNADFGR